MSVIWHLQDIRKRVGLPAPSASYVQFLRHLTLPICDVEGQCQPTVHHYRGNIGLFDLRVIQFRLLRVEKRMDFISGRFLVESWTGNRPSLSVTDKVSGFREMSPSDLRSDSHCCALPSLRGLRTHCSVLDPPSLGGVGCSARGA